MTTFWEIPAAYVFGVGGKSGTLMYYEKRKGGTGMS
jgi:hypothetical protein